MHKKPKKDKNMTRIAVGSELWLHKWKKYIDANKKETQSERVQMKINFASHSR